MPFNWFIIIATFIIGSLITGLLTWLILRSKCLILEKELEEKFKASLKNIELETKVKEEQLLQKIDNEKLSLDVKFKNYQLEHEQKQNELIIAIEDVRAEKINLENKQLECARLEIEGKEKLASAENYQQLYRARLNTIANISEAEALNLLKIDLANECENELKHLRQELLVKPLANIENEAKRILVDAMQRITTTTISPFSSGIIKLPNEEIKGRLIGKEGRNIKTFELTTGATLLIDETPGIVTVSCFDPVRREIAELALADLVRDGRIHPASIEECVEIAKNKVEQKIAEESERALDLLGIMDIHPEISALLGKLYYRLSNNQNTLEHCIEVSYLCSTIAHELQLDPIIAKRCGLFHDLGKAMGCEIEGSHAVAAANLLKRCGEDPRVVNAVAASHNDTPPESIYAEVLKIADAISASRPGARSDSTDGYLRRMHELEGIAMSYKGIVSAFAMQAGRELRVIVNPSVYQDDGALLLAGNIRDDIKEKVNFPGPVKVTVIREQRFIETAK